MKKLLLLGLACLVLCTGSARAEFDARRAAVLDANRDGRPDLVVGTSNTLYVFQGLGGGQFDIGTRLPGAYITIDSLDVRDMNGDGAEDLVVGTGRAQQVWYSGQDSQLVLGSSTRVDAITHALRAADLDGDGTPELVLLESDRVTVLSRSGDTWKVDYEAVPPVDAHGVSVGDLNGDGCEDLCIGLTGNAKVWLWLGRKAGKPRMSTFTMGRPGGQGALGDFDGDGHLDYACGWDRGLLVANGKGDGTFASARVVDLGRPVNNQSVLAADFDGDGRADVVTSDWESQEVLIFPGAEGPPSSVLQTGQLCLLDVGDFDGDGLPDLLLDYNLLRELPTLRNAGHGRFEPGPTLKR